MPATPDSERILPVRASRDEELYQRVYDAKVNQGLTFVEIGAREGFSRQRAQAIARAMGYQTDTPRPRGVARARRAA